MESLIILLFLIVLMTYFYTKIKKTLPILIIFLFSIIIGMVSFGSFIPYSPWFSLFFILYQTIIFYLHVDEKNFRVW